MRLRTLILASIPFSALLGCGGGGASGGPVEPPAPGIEANIVAASGLTFGLCTGTAAGCDYRQEYTNAGPGCANNLHGKIRVYQEDTLLETDDWWLDPSFVLQPGERTPVEDCCFDEDTVRLRTRTTEEAFWNNVPCR